MVLEGVGKACDWAPLRRRGPPVVSTGGYQANRAASRPRLWHHRLGVGATIGLSFPAWGVGVGGGLRVLQEPRVVDSKDQNL